MKVIDVSGPIYTGMRSYADYYPDFKLSAVEFEFGGDKYSVDVFEGMHAQTAIYLESPGRYLEENPYTINDIPIEKLYMVDTYHYVM